MFRPGAPRTVDDERVAQLIQTTLHTKPANGSTHWSVRSVAAETGISKSSVQRYFQLFGLQPHRAESSKLSTDPFFVEKLRDVVGLYLSPPDERQAVGPTHRPFRHRVQHELLAVSLDCRCGLDSREVASTLFMY